ncbi:MAG TPA: L-rhamnose/proton symporter RhaT [Bacteroidetes bacterium]|nr:L-rhamnose/proton symporter RhaT [Bacteroidota bacterium]
MGSIIGVILHAIGGFAAGSFYIPINFVKKWKWETSWLVLGIAAWVIAPFLFAYFTTPQLFEVLMGGDNETIFWTYFFGVLWGVGALTFGLTMRYLGISLGMTVALGFTTAFGTLIPPIYRGEFMNLMNTLSGRVVFAGIILALIGIAISGWAGTRKEKEVDDKTKKESVKEFSLWKGLLVASISGILSASFAFGLAAGKPIAQVSLEHGTRTLFQNNAVLVWILWGGITTNLIWCLILNYKNKSFEDYTDKNAPLLKNYLWAIAGGLTWYLQFFFYGMGTTFLGKKYDFASWSIHMAFIILFSNLWGVYFKEWKGVSAKTKRILALGLFTIITAILMVGLGSNL